MRDHELHCNGILPPLTTPFDEQGRVDFAALRRNIARYNEAGLAGYVALGSNGEAIHLSREEQTEVIETIKQAARPDHTVIAGVNEFSTHAAIAATQRAADVGADAALVITPYFYKSRMTQAALSEHFIAVAEASPLPVFIYNVPQNTGVTIEPATIARLAEHANIAGVKDSAGNFAALAETIRLAPADLQVMIGNGGILYPSLLMGASGAILAVACAAPRACVELYEALRAGDGARARDLQNRLAPLSHIVTAGLGVAALKAAMALNGFVGGQPRAPLAPLSEPERERVRAVMRDTGLFPEME
ncbi:MAG TPA: 4-hydroxy-tetrahydrodipicolinate synthase [Blastocatellia bacterium]|nr:4-hydroxy-tetrahydrodipicolinate synthase [Blastocatellia bacterium]